MHPPRLREAHAHILEFGREMSLVDLASTSDVREALATIAQAASERFRDRPSGDWLVARGLRVSAWPDPRWPTMGELDEACPERPCLVMGFDHHSAAVNSLAFDATGLASDASLAPMIERDAQGQPSGLLLEGAYARAVQCVPPPQPDELLAHARLACQSLAAMGFVEAHDLLAPPTLGPIAAELFDRGELPMRVGLYAPYDQIAAQHEASRQWGRPGVQLLGAKLFADGTLNSRTAHVLEPFRRPLSHAPRGVSLLSVAQMAEAMRACDALGLGLAIHAIGDAAVRGVLDAREMALPSSLEGEQGSGRRREGALGDPGQPLPPLKGRRGEVRIEHGELIDSADVPRFAELGVMASIQPCHLLCDIEVLRDQLPHRLDRVLPLRDLIASGLVPGESLIFGSDVPIVRANPEDSIQAAVQRRRAGMAAGEAIAPEQAISEDAAWACFATREGASEA